MGDLQLHSTKRLHRECQKLGMVPMARRWKVRSWGLQGLCTQVEFVRQFKQCNVNLISPPRLVMDCVACGTSMHGVGGHLLCSFSRCAQATPSTKQTRILHFALDSVQHMKEVELLTWESQVVGNPMEHTVHEANATHVENNILKFL